MTPHVIGTCGDMCKRMGPSLDRPIIFSLFVLILDYCCLEKLSSHEEELLICAHHHSLAVIERYVTDNYPHSLKLGVVWGQRVTLASVGVMVDVSPSLRCATVRLLGFSNGVRSWSSRRAFLPKCRGLGQPLLLKSRVQAHSLLIWLASN